MTGFILIALGILCLAIIYFLTKHNEEKSKIKNDLLDYKLFDEVMASMKQKKLEEDFKLFIEIQHNKKQKEKEIVKQEEDKFDEKTTFQTSQPKTNQHRANRLSLQETGTQYAAAISNLLQTNPRFWDIYEYNISQIQNLTFGEIWQPLQNGVVIIDDHHTLIKYIASYGGHHYQKLQTSFVALLPHITANSNIDIVDYGCGQALATTLFYDYMLRNNKNYKVNKVTLIEPSDLALKRGILKLNHFINHKQQNTEVKKINKKLDEVTVADLTTNNTNIKIHFFSNILDVTSFDIQRLVTKIKNTQKGTNYFVCVSPFNETAQTQITSFQNQFNGTNINCQSEIIYKPAYDIRNRRMDDSYRITMFQRIFKCNFVTVTTRTNNFQIDNDLPF